MHTEPHIVQLQYIFRYFMWTFERNDRNRFYFIFFVFFFLFVVVCFGFLYFSWSHILSLMYGSAIVSFCHLPTSTRSIGVCDLFLVTDDLCLLRCVVYVNLLYFFLWFVFGLNKQTCECRHDQRQWTNKFLERFGLVGLKKKSSSDRVSTDSTHPSNHTHNRRIYGQLMEYPFD